jgi:primary-amine oxidase
MARPQGTLYEAVVGLPEGGGGGGGLGQAAGSSTPSSSSGASNRQAGPLYATTSTTTTDHVTTWKRIDGVQPTTTPDDNHLAERVILADPGVRQLLKERYGVEDLSLVVFDPWTLHGTPDHLKGRRLMQGFLYMRHGHEADNEYAHPLDLVPLVDLNEEKVVHVDMYDKPAILPPVRVNYHRQLAHETSGAPWRTDVQPLNITQPQGPSFVVRGNEVSWQKWRLRVGFNAREGLVLHDVGFDEVDASGQVVRTRPVLHRASLSEMAVPYGEPHAPYVRKCALDVGDYGMGFVANSLELGCDCLGHIKYFDGVVNNARGDPVVIRKAICMHEEDAGLLWKHTDTRLGGGRGHVEVRRSRRLVLSMVSTFANYEYAMYWSLYQDGTIQLEMKLTGILSTSLAPLPDAARMAAERAQAQGLGAAAAAAAATAAAGSAGAPAYGTLVSPGVIAANHQHLFCVRLDPSIDDVRGGRGLVVAEVNAEPLPVGPQNPHGNAFAVTETDLLSVHAAMRDPAPHKARAWKVKNPRMLNPVTGKPVAFKLVPTASSAPMLMQPTSLVGRRAFFASKALFVTPHDDRQLYAAGEHVVQSEDCLGLKVWTREDKPLVGGGGGRGVAAGHNDDNEVDPVLWYSFGVTHLPRVEDFPVMPVETVGFQLKPFGFFAWNPALDLPAERNAASREELTAPPRDMGMARARI